MGGRAGEREGPGEEGRGGAESRGLKLGTGALPVLLDDGIAGGLDSQAGAAAFEVDAGGHRDETAVNEYLDGGAVLDDGEGIGVAFGLSLIHI